jgi:aryl-alcohol dehydrogenase-like predicted oxidoreductase
MRHRLLGPTGLRVSQLCLGTMTFGEQKAWGADEAAAGEVLARFIGAGGTFLDTAPNYSGGAAEEIVGRFAAGRRDELVIATKFTASARAHPLAGGNSRKSLRQAVEGSLRRLKTDHIDLLWLHYWDGTTHLDEILAALDDLVHAGKVLYLGISDAPAWLVSRAATLAQLRNQAPIAAVQLEYNLAARTSERELLPMAASLGLGVLAWGPLAAGALAAGPDPQRRKAASLPPVLVESAAALSEIAGSLGLSPATVAVAWLLGKGVIPIVGARSPDQLSAALASSDVQLSSETVAALDALVAVEKGFPHDLIGSSYLRKMALGAPQDIEMPANWRA